MDMLLQYYHIIQVQFLLDELADKIKMEQSYKELLKGVNKIKRKLVAV